LRNSKQTAEQAPAESFAVGCLGILALFILIVLSALTIIGIPIALALIVVLVAGFVLFEVVRTLADIVPFAGGLLSFTLSAIVMSLGVGAAILSRGGQNVYPGGTLFGYLPGATGDNIPPPAPGMPDTPDRSDPLDSLFADLDADQAGDASDKDAPDANGDDQPPTPAS